MDRFIFFILIFVFTAVLVRFIAYSMGNRRTLTHEIRYNTHLYFHHIYLGIIIIALIAPFIVVYGLTDLLLILLAVGLSLCLDELPAVLLYGQYPNKKELKFTIALYVFMIIYTFLIMKVF